VGKEVRSNLFIASLVLVLTASCSNGPSPNTSTGAVSGAASYARARLQTPNPAGGSISGGIGYPSEFLPAQAVYAIRTDGSRYYRVETAVGQQHYTLLGVGPGDYFVLTAVRTPGFYQVASGARTAQVTRFGAGYTKAVPCGLSVECVDHTLLQVTVLPGSAITGINPGDWYAPADWYPLVPGGGPPPLLDIPTPPAAFATADEAAGFLAQSRTGSRLVPSRDACPINDSCVWLTGRRDGHAATYFTGGTGSNQDVLTCGFYLVDDAGWRPLDFRCGTSHTPFPAVGSSGRVLLRMGETGCVNVHFAPGLSAKVVACLPDGATVQLDDGPYFLLESNATLDPPSMLNYWWHIAGKGWMVHWYLFASS
jgi:hypothetical protein